MATEVLNVEVRESRGKRAAKRMRSEGMTPAILYGHGQENVALAVKTDDLDAALRHGAHLVDLAGGVKESAFLRDIQWDPFGNYVMHVDLTRISRDESVEVTLAIELRGVAPGTSSGGVIEQPKHEIAISCKASDIPEKISVSINDLELGGAIIASQLELPAGATIVGDDSAVVVSCVEPTAQSEDDETPQEAGAEPEVIGRKEDSEDQDDS